MAWLLALGVSAGYLINKNRTMQSMVETAVAKYNEDAIVEPATDGVTTAEIRATRKADPYHTIGQYHVDATSEMRTDITSEQQSMLNAMRSFEAGAGKFDAVLDPSQKMYAF